MSSTVTVAVHVPALPFTSVAVRVTVFGPTDEQSNEELTKQLNKLWLKINERCKPGAPKPKPYKKRPYKGKKPAKTQQK